jgi:hypothetical protein
MVTFPAKKIIKFQGRPDWKINKNFEFFGGKFEFLLADFNFLEKSKMTRVKICRNYWKSGKWRYPFDLFYGPYFYFITVL